jgi:membrane-associated phospholipid phosphatase
MSARHQALTWPNKAPHTAPSDSSSDPSDSFVSSWRDSPIGGRLAPARLAGWWICGYVAIVATATLVGFAITHGLDDTWIGRADADTATWFEEHRTRPLDHASWWISQSADVIPKTTWIAILTVAFALRWRRWTEPLFLVSTMTLEVAAFATTAAFVGRPRPPIEQMDSSPPTAAFPSGHVAASFALYGALAIIATWHTRREWFRRAMFVFAVVFPTVVGVVRIYRGMHHATDTIVGAALGLAALWVGTRIVGEGVRPMPVASRPRRQPGEPTASVPDDEHGSETVAALVADHPMVVRIGRIGWVAKGLVYGLAGLVGALVAGGWRRDTGRPEDEASMSGAIATIAQSRPGSVALALITAGLLLYVMWRAVTIALPATDGTETWLNRAGYTVSVVLYLVLAWTAVTYIRSPGAPAERGRSEDARVEQFTRSLLGNPVGRVTIGLIGVIMIAAGLVFAHKAVRRHFDDHLSRRDLGPIRYEQLAWMGRVGWLGRSAMMLLIGFFLVRAAWTFDTTDVGGLDAALRRAVDHPVGAVLAWVAAGGLVVYGAYCVLSAPRKRLAAADE